jgi:hypothetical protein
MIMSEFTAEERAALIDLLAGVIEHDRFPAITAHSAAAGVAAG